MVVALLLLPRVAWADLYVGITTRPRRRSPPRTRGTRSFPSRPRRAPTSRSPDGSPESADTSQISLPPLQSSSLKLTAVITLGVASLVLAGNAIRVLQLEADLVLARLAEAVEKVRESIVEFR
jgi:hypothetical protein